MDIKKENEILINHWNEAFKAAKIDKINKDDYENNSTLSQAIIEMANREEKILDIGTGFGQGLFTAKFYGKAFKEGVGIDPSKYVIDTLNKACLNSSIDDIRFIHSNHNILKEFSDGSFDGIICSNVLDVLPKYTSFEIVDQIKRLLKPNGTFVLKLNFYLTEDLVKKLNMECVESDTFKMNGVIRGLNFSTDDWIEIFKPFKIVKVDTYERIKNGPLDRILVFKK